MTNIKELATLTAAEMDNIYLRNVPAIILEQYAARLIAAYLAEQEPVVRVVDGGGELHLPKLQWVSANHSLETPIGSTLFTAPPEPAPQQQKPQITIGEPADPAQPAAVCAAPSSEGVRGSLKWLREADFGAMQEYASRVADLIERLAARVPDGGIATLEQQTITLSTIICETAKELGCVADNEAILIAIVELNQQVAALTKERDDLERISSIQAANAFQLVAAQAREAKLQGKLFHFGRHHSNCGWQMNRPCNCGFDEALPVDDSALMERLKQEREKVITFVKDYSDEHGLITTRIIAAIRSMT